MAELEEEEMLKDAVKMSLRITTEKFDTEIAWLIGAALADLQMTDITNVSVDDMLIRRAVITYCKMNFGTPEPSEYNRLKLSYDEQKAQLSMRSGYTTWEGSENAQ